MGEIAGTETETPVENSPQEDQELTQGQGEIQDTGGGNPAWKEFLDVLPSQLHPTVTPVLEKWDRGVQERFQEVHSQYDPFKSFVERGIDADTLNQAYQIMEMLNNDPRRIYDALGQYNGWAEQQGQENSQQVVDPSLEGYQPEEFVDPQFQELRQGFETLAQLELQRYEEAEAQQADSAVDADLARAKDILGDSYNENYILRAMYTGVTAEQAAQEYQQLIEQARQTALPRPSDKAPVVMGGGGGLPSQQIPTSQLTDAGRRKLVADTLARLSQEGK